MRDLQVSIRNRYLLLTNQTTVVVTTIIILNGMNVTVRLEKIIANNLVINITVKMAVSICIVMNLPRSFRYKQGNVHLIGLIPGPKEPKHDIIHF